MKNYRFKIFVLFFVCLLLPLIFYGQSTDSGNESTKKKKSAMQKAKDREANEQMIRNIARMLKKEDYQSIQCAGIDDSIVTFEEEALTSLV